ncbi:acyl carrier protein [Streptomyces ginkgonis]|uniref:acyl carrier protein n=1 Tax=Streptomyces ginkgonis TaxID=1812259 RepID=UPI0021769858|nr:acyl carrier protein [Streptomyces ginkgonis]
MTTTTPPGTDAVLPTVRAELLDCVQSNLAVLADRGYGAGTHLALGATLRFRPSPGPAALPTVEPPLTAELAGIGRLGLAEAARLHRPDRDALVELAREYGTVYVLADAYDMPWLPYHGRRRMEHSYLVEYAPDAAQVTDAYHNRTPWGTAEPQRLRTGWDRLPASSLALALVPASAGVPDLPPALDLGPADGYLAAYADHPDRVTALERLTVETWLLARSRKLHAAFRARYGLPCGAQGEEQLRRWDRLAEQTFLALRRVERGRPEPQRLLGDLAAVLAADRTVFALPGGPAGDGLRTTVARVVASVTGCAPETVLRSGDLTELPGFDSFRVVEIVERLEEHLGTAFDPEDLLPENLHRLDDLCRLAATRGRA